ncbi:hypothetical protein ACROYT_G015397 [Oculina patagonica]
MYGAHLKKSAKKRASRPLATRIIGEAVPRQVNYLIDEASDNGKGANTTISYVHHYFQSHRLGEERKRKSEDQEEPEGGSGGKNAKL